MTQEMQALEQQDALLARLGEYYAATGNRAEAVATRFKRLELRVSHEALQAAQAVTFMDFNNFAPAASVLSAATGASIQIQPLDNNTFNLLANGQVFGEGLTFDQLKGYVRSVTDAEYRQQQAALNELVVAAEIERRGKDADAINTMMLEVAKLVQTGENAAALELLRQNEFAVEATDAGIVLYKKDSSEMYLVNPDGRITKANGDTVSGPTSTRIDIK
jgi:tetratricopeptide (TPR) repeat protein